MSKFCWHIFTTNLTTNTENTFILKLQTGFLFRYLQLKTIYDLKKTKTKNPKTFLRSCSPIFSSQNASHSVVAVGGVRGFPVHLLSSLWRVTVLLFLLFLLLGTFNELQDKHQVIWTGLQTSPVLDTDVQFVLDYIKMTGWSRFCI